MERFSKKRQAILECLRGTDTHPTAEWVYGQLKPYHPSLSLGTVYRNLCQLKDAGLICSMGVVAGQEHFDGNVDPHAHVLCTCCGRIDDLAIDSSIQLVLRNAAMMTDFQSLSPQFAGLCPQCYKEQQKS